MTGSHRESVNQWLQTDPDILTLQKQIFIIKTKLWKRSPTQQRPRKTFFVLRRRIPLFVFWIKVGNFLSPELHLLRI